jgi:hypothetical protein
MPVARASDHIISRDIEYFSDLKRLKDAKLLTKKQKRKYRYYLSESSTESESEDEEIPVSKPPLLPHNQKYFLITLDAIFLIL